MMKLIYGLLVCTEQPQSFPTVMNSINSVGYWKRPGHIRSHLNSSFQISPFTSGPSKRKKKKLLFCPSCPCPHFYNHSFVQLLIIRNLCKTAQETLDKAILNSNELYTGVYLSLYPLFFFFSLSVSISVHPGLQK